MCKFFTDEHEKVENNDNNVYSTPYFHILESLCPFVICNHIFGLRAEFSYCFLFQTCLAADLKGKKLPLPGLDKMEQDLFTGVQVYHWLLCLVKG